MKRSFELYLNDILLSISKIFAYVHNLDYDGFNEDSLVVDGVVRNLEIIGEAVTQIPEDVKNAHSEIPWDKIKSFRNVVVHKYWIVDKEILWDIVQNKLGGLKAEILKLLAQEKMDEKHKEK